MFIYVVRYVYTIIYLSRDIYVFFTVMYNCTYISINILIYIYICKCFCLYTYLNNSALLNMVVYTLMNIQVYVQVRLYICLFSHNLFTCTDMYTYVYIYECCYLLLESLESLSAFLSGIFHCTFDISCRNSSIIDLDTCYCYLLITFHAISCLATLLLFSWSLALMLRSFTNLEVCLALQLFIKKDWVVQKLFSTSSVILAVYWSAYTVARFWKRSSIPSSEVDPCTSHIFLPPVLNVIILL